MAVNGSENKEVGVGRHTWVIADGYIPGESASSDSALISHEAACIINTGPLPAHVSLRLYFADRDPAGPYEITVGPERTLHLRLNDLKDPEPLPCDKDYSCVLHSDVPVVVQHTRLDSRVLQHALLSTIAWSGPE